MGRGGTWPLKEIQLEMYGNFSIFRKNTLCLVYFTDVIRTKYAFFKSVKELQFLSYLHSLKPLFFTQLC